MIDDWFATKLAEGATQAPALTSWWPRHARLVANCVYLKDCHEDFDRSALAARGLGAEWERRVPFSMRPRRGSTLGLMTEHAVLEIALLQAVFQGDEAGVDKYSQRLLKNAEVQNDRYGKHLRGFPKGRFRHLMREHISTLMTLTMHWLDAGEMEGPEEAYRTTTAAMAALSTEWF